MMHYENVNVNVVLVDHNVVYMEYVVQQLEMVVDDNNQLFQLIYHVLNLNLNLIHVEYVQFFHQLFHVYYHVLIVQIHHDENIVVDHVLVVKVIVIGMVILVVIVVQLIVQSMDNIIHNNQGMFLLNMLKHDDVLYVEQVVYLNKQLQKLRI
jgi:hypothetical protein